MFFFKKKTQWQSDLTDHACSPLLRDYKIIVYIVILLTLLADLCLHTFLILIGYN